ncbi:MAG: hypothetical protein M3501_09175 [Actinomycetota bacterium]|nr:hypothetical protein [Actinomycetota bacterium]MDQ3352116.1 hypothetical protein [Actinomycetota bacterium]
MTSPPASTPLVNTQANIRAVNPTARTIHLSATTGEGVDEWCDWLIETQKAH